MRLIDDEGHFEKQGPIPCFVTPVSDAIYLWLIAGFIYVNKIGRGAGGRVWPQDRVTSGANVRTRFQKG